MKNYLKIKLLAILLFVVALSTPVLLLAQDGELTIKLSVTDNDSVRTCKAIVMDGITPVEGTDVNFYVKRFFGMMPLALAETTDENGEASMVFQKRLPGDSLGNITIVARLDDDDAILSEAVAPWGTKVSNETASQRALWGSRANAPVYLIVISLAIIIGVYGTMGYVLYYLFFKMKKSGLGYNP